MAKYKNTEIFACPVAEGVRVHLGNATAFAVRQSPKDIAVRVRRERRPVRHFLEQLPFVRGIVRLLMALWGFMDSISESSEMHPQEVSRGNRFEQRFAELFRFKSTAMVAFISALVIVCLLPALVLGLPWIMEHHVLSGIALSRFQLNLIVVITRIVGLLTGVFIVARLRIVRRFCMYQGAINKVLNAYEYEGKQLLYKDTVDQSIYHPRSDSVFLLLVAIIAIIAFAFVQTYTLHIQIIVRLLMLLAIAAIVNEPLHFLENANPDNRFFHALLMPIYRLERLFVFEPHAQMVEVALCAFNDVRKNDVW